MPAPSLRLHGVSFSFTDAAPLLEDVTLHLAAGWTGLVGDNGSGKTTLLRLIAGDVEPHAGHVHIDPARARVVLCPQIVDAPDPAIAAFERAEGPAARALRGRLRLDARVAPARWETLSPGERKRWQIGAALAAEPDILLLDEPTNHLDREARDLLLDALARHRGVGVVVSHDRALLDVLTVRTVRVHRRAATLYAGPYGEARRAWLAEEAALGQTRDRLSAERKKIATRLADARRERDAAGAQRSGRKRSKNAGDRDARSVNAQVRADLGEASLSRSVEVSRRKLDRAEEAVSAIRVEKEHGGSIFVDWRPPPRPQLFAVDFRGHALAVARDARIRIAGANGAGKTTLLSKLLASATLSCDRVLHVPQELAAGEGTRLLREMRALPPAERGRVLSIVAALGTDPDRLLASEAPSPGEARKLLIARGLARHAWVVALDEPTNHLDLPSIERLERALADYPGALLLVTHDDAFAAALARETWTLAPGELRVT